MFLFLIRKKGDAFGFPGHRNDVLIVHHEASCGVAAQVDVDEEVVVARTKQTCGLETHRNIVINIKHLKSLTLN